MVPFARTQQEPLELSPEQQRLDRIIKLSIVGGAAGIMLLGLVFGSLPIKLMCAVIGLATLQGLWRGAAELAGLVVGTLVALVLAPPLGRVLEGVFEAIGGSSGLLNRFISIGVVGLIIVAGFTVGVSIGAKKVMASRPQWKRWDPYAGAGIGLFEGALLGFAILWTPLALEPVATAQMEYSQSVGDEELAPTNPVAERIVKLAVQVRDSGMGGIAQGTNPIEGSRLLTLTNDFVAVSRDRMAMDYLMKTDVMRQIKEMPSINAAMERVKQDNELASMVKGDGVTTGTLMTVIRSRTILEVFDSTSVVEDMAPLVEPLAQAIAEAKERIGTRPPPE